MNGTYVYLEFICLMCCEINRLQNSISPATKARRVKWTVFPKSRGDAGKVPLATCSVCFGLDMWNETEGARGRGSLPQ